METSQMFVFIVSIVVVGLVLLFGVRSIGFILDQNSEVEYINLKNDIINRIDDLSSDYGSVKQVSFSVPPDYTHVCFVELDGAPELVQIDDVVYPLIQDAWEDGTANVFLVDESIQQSFKESRIKVNSGVTGQNYLCIAREQGTAKVRLEGVGRAVEVSRWR